MDSKIYLSLIIPAYNEVKRIPLTLIDADRHLHDAGFQYEIIVVDEASTDGTKEVADKFSKLINNLKVMSTENRGRGPRSGLACLVPGAVPGLHRFR